MSLRYFLPVYLLAYFIAAFFWRSYLVWKKTGVNPVVFKGTDSAHDFVGRIFKALFAVIVAIVIIYAFIPSAYQYVMPLHSLERTSIRLTGFILLLVSLIWTVVAQAQMGNSWRIGIDTEQRTKLVQTGVFKLSRNPIFVGMIVTLLGLFLVNPQCWNFHYASRRHHLDRDSSAAGGGISDGHTWGHVHQISPQRLEMDIADSESAR